MQLAGGSAFLVGILLLDTFVIVEPLPPAPANMVWIEPGSFVMGSDKGLPDERPAHQLSMSGFWIDQFEVTNENFEAFVTATKYTTQAESYGDSQVFHSQEQKSSDALVIRSSKQKLRAGPMDWWDLVAQADWRHPQGPADSITDKSDHPVVHVSYADALAYCNWAGKELPTEAQFEFAARGGREGAIYAWGDQPLHRSQAITNNWQGTFPFKNEVADGFASTAPVGSFPPNDFGLYDITGNVWEWVSDWYHPNYYAMSKAKNPRGVSEAESLDPAEPNLAKRSIRGGSFLCSDNYCSGFRVSARMPADPNSGTVHTGFRCVVNNKY